MTKRISKVLCLIVAVLMVTGIFASCKSKSTDDPAQTLSKSATTAKAASATPAKQTGTAANKTNSSTNKPDSTVASSDSTQPGGSDGYTSDGTPAVNQPGDSPLEGGKIGSNNPAETKIDLGGRKFVIASRDAMPDPATADIVGKVTYNSYMAAQSKYNFVLEYKLVSGGTDVIANEFINATLAGMQFADVVGLATKQVFPKIVENNYVAPIDDYVDFNSPLYNTNYMKTVGLWKDKHYGFTRPVYAASSAVFYNRDIFESQGLPDPQQLYEAGRWDWESLLQIAQAATRDMNGDGVIDQWGLELHKSDYNGVAFLNSNGMEYFDYVNGKVQFMLNDPRAIRALQFMSDLINTYKVATPQLKSGGFKQNGAAMYMGDLLASVKGYNEAGINTGMVMVPKGPDVDKPQTINAGGHIWAFPTNANLKEAIPVFMDMLTIWDPNKPEHVTYEDYNYNYILGKGYTNQKDIDFAMKYCADPKISMYQSMGDLQKLISKEVYDKIINLQSTPAAALDAVAGPAQQMIDAWIETQ